MPAQAPGLWLPPQIWLHQAAPPAAKKTAPRRVPGGGCHLRGRAQASLALAISVSWVKAALSLTASSASILRLMVTPAFFRPFMKVE